MRLASQFKALSEHVRLQILTLIFRYRELCVCEVERLLGISQSKASRHLRYLLNAGILQDRRDGLWVYYRVAEPDSEEQQLLLDALGRLLEYIEIPDVSDDLSTMRAERCYPENARACVSNRPPAEVR